MPAYMTIPTEKEATQAWSKYAKSVWFKGLPKETQMAFKKGYGWDTNRHGYPAVKSSDGEWLITFKKDMSGEVFGYISKTNEGENKMSKTLNKIDRFLNESDFAADFPSNTSKYMGRRPIQFMKWWKNFRPGDRMDVMFSEDVIEIKGTNAEGQFAGVKKGYMITDPMELETFKGSEGDIWNFV